MTVKVKYERPVYGSELVEARPAVKRIVEAQGAVKKILRSETWYDWIRSQKDLNTAELVGQMSDDISIRLWDTFTAQVRRQIRLHADEAGVKLTQLEVDEMVGDFGFGGKFLGKTLEQRMAAIRKDMMKGVEDIMSDFTIKNKAEAIKDFMTGKYWGTNAYRPMSRLAVSEFNRIGQETASFVGESLANRGIHARYEWILSTLPNRKYDICDVYAHKRFFTAATLPRYPHPFCACEVRIVL